MKIMEKIIKYGIYLFVFLLPWQTRLILSEGNLNGYWEYGTISVHATEILLLVIFILTTAWWLFIEKTKKQENQKTNRESKILFFCLLVFLTYSLVSIFWADSKSMTLQAWVRLAEGTGLFLILRVIKIDWTKVAWAFVTGAVIQAGLGVWQFLTQSTFGCKWLGMAVHDPIEPGTYVVETALRRWLRAYGALPHPNMLAGFLVTAIFFAIWLYQKTEYGLKRLFLPIFFCILTSGLLATFSKSALVALGAAVIFLWATLFFTRQRREVKINLLKFTLFFLVITVLFSIIFWEPVSTRIYGQNRLEIKSTEERLSYFNQSWQIIKKHPVFGVGIGNYTLALHNEIDPDLQVWDYQPVHNIYLLILAELGIVGFIFWLLLMIFIIKELPATRYPLPVAILVIGIFDHYFWSLYFGVILFWLIFSFRNKFQPLDDFLDKA